MIGKLFLLAVQHTDTLLLFLFLVQHIDIRLLFLFPMQHIETRFYHRRGLGSTLHVMALMLWVTFKFTVPSVTRCLIIRKDYFLVINLFAFFSLSLLPLSFSWMMPADKTNMSALTLQGFSNAICSVYLYLSSYMERITSDQIETAVVMICIVSSVIA